MRNRYRSDTDENAHDAPGKTDGKGTVNRMDIKEQALKKHKEWGGKIEVISRAQIETKEDLALAYTPGVAAACLEIAENETLAYD